MSEGFILLSIWAFLGSLFLVPFLYLPSVAVAIPVYFIGRSWAYGRGRRFPGYYLVFIAGAVVTLALTVLFIVGVWDTAFEYDGSTGAAVAFSILGVVLFAIGLSLLVLLLKCARGDEQPEGHATVLAYAGILACTFSVAAALSTIQWIAGVYHYLPIGPLVQGPPGPNWLRMLIGE